MGTFHSFVSQPLTEQQEMDYLISVKKVISSSTFKNDPEKFRVVNIGKDWVVVGVYKNLGNVPAELMGLWAHIGWATVSDEGDYSNNNPKEYF